MRKNEGEAAMYGITYDDSDYDYMAHLRPLNQPGASDVVLLPAPKGSGVAKGMKPDRKGKGKAEELFGLPQDMFASRDERTMKEVYESAQDIPDELRGLQPDMDPHLRQVLEALEDEAFVDGEGEDIFDELLAGGEKADGEEAEEFEFDEWGIEDEDEEDPGTTGGEADDEVPPAEEETWEDRFKAFKAAQKSGNIAPADASEVDEAERSEMADTVGSLSSMADMMVIGGKKRRGKRGPSDATGMSMSSSSMFRNEGLRDLDERFDQVSGVVLDEPSQRWSTDMRSLRRRTRSEMRTTTTFQTTRPSRSPLRSCLRHHACRSCRTQPTFPKSHERISTTFSTISWRITKWSGRSTGQHSVALA